MGKNNRKKNKIGLKLWQTLQAIPGSYGLYAKG
jgi:hypothetical protein